MREVSGVRQLQERPVVDDLWLLIFLLVALRRAEAVDFNFVHACRLDGMGWLRQGEKGASRERYRLDRRSRRVT
jgi:hypothetical protein